MIFVFEIIRILQFVTTILWKEIPVPMPNEEKKSSWMFMKYTGREGLMNL